MWAKTSAEVYAVIHARHSKEMCIHSSFTDSTGNGYEFSTGKPTIDTEYGFKDSDEPLVRIEARKETEDQKQWDYSYFIYYSTENSTEKK